MVSGRNKNFAFTVIAGSLKGRKIIAPDLGITRPPLTRLRKAIFDFLMPYLPRAHYLDLFSGSGSYLFEAVSRGISQAIGVEHDKQLVKAINDQAEKFQVADKLHCLEGDVFKVIPQLARQGKAFDIIMIAPPQYMGFVDKTLNSLKDHDILSKTSLIICQHDTSETKKIDFSGFSVNQHRKYGNTTFTILKS
ncbi:MAG: 16S rRNA (guanine(966)-N(2))-methyltransferase RsmD [candidate division Zixibacteria bacterium]|nr:16S rRNA (guanine(966)-N(2))-methyltransferase RsmD [candidate division Zixibacteria bacterium]MDD5424978.1 16S rRNA (guanine(966)-N(2))-methyltransferase RsmD [candidate division Zixibacteria bacterium]